MSFITLKTTQKEFLEQYLRGTGRSISARQAEATYGIKNLRARVCELKKAGLKINRALNTEGRTAYSISARDIEGSRSRIFG